MPAHRGESEGRQRPPSGGDKRNYAFMEALIGTSSTFTE